METVQANLTTFQGEYLWELSIPEKQVIALAEATPEQAYGWRPAADARSFSEALVHIAAACLMLLYRAEIRTPEVLALCESVEPDGMAKWLGQVRRGLELERTTTAKADVIHLLNRGFAEVRTAFCEANEQEMNTTRDFGGEMTTMRRIYLRILAHSHEHMGQVVAYARAMGFKTPWPDPIKEMERIVAAGER